MSNIRSLAWYRNKKNMTIEDRLKWAEEAIKDLENLQDMLVARIKQLEDESIARGKTDPIR